MQNYSSCFVLHLSFSFYKNKDKSFRVILLKTSIYYYMIDLTTPSLLFSAISLILLAYTNRFLAYTNVIRTLVEKHRKEKEPRDIAQIANLRKRLSLIRAMQIFGITSLLLCVVAMFFVYISIQIIAAWIFGVALLSLAVSLGLCIWEINISVRALDIHLKELSCK